MARRSAAPFENGKATLARRSDRFLDGLVERGFLAREPVPGDRRSVRIGLTSAGRVALATAEVAMAAVLEAALPAEAFAALENVRL